MKIGILPRLLLLFLTIPFFAEAQLSWGVKAAAANYYSLTQVKNGFHLGATAKIPLSGKLSFAPELLFTNRGFEFALRDKADYNYLEVPCQLSYQLSKTIDLQTGIDFSFKLTPDLAIKPFFYGLSASGIIHLTEKVFLSIRYNRDFSPLINDSSGWSLFSGVGYYLKS